MPANKFRHFARTTFVVTNLISAVCFLLGCYAYKVQTNTLWMVGFFPLATFYFLLILVAFIFFWLFVKPIRALISLVAIVIAWYPLQHLVQLRLSPNFTMEKHPKNLRVMSWNVEHFEILQHKKHPEQKAEMLSMINQHQPDVACFQEMVASDFAPDAINYIPDFLKKLGFVYYHFTYNPKLDFDGKHRFGIITFSKYPIVKKHNISYPPNDYNSIFQYADIVKDTDTFRVFNLHLQSLKFTNDNINFIEDASLKNRNDIQQSKSVLRRFRSGFQKRFVQSNRIKAAVDKSPYPVIVCGDFNDVPNSYAYNTIGKGLKNTFEQKGTGIGRTFFSLSPTLRIDDIFVDKRFTVEQFLRIKKKLSDHYPIITDLYYEK
ncbi:MAG: endonuclease/exonuclease/phosphatase family protein [Ferruginibacter sp.]